MGECLLSRRGSGEPSFKVSKVEWITLEGKSDTGTITNPRTMDVSGYRILFSYRARLLHQIILPDYNLHICLSERGIEESYIQAMTQKTSFGDGCIYDPLTKQMRNDSYADFFFAIK